MLWKERKYLFNQFEPMTDVMARELSVASLAYLGDTLFDLLIRSHIVVNKRSSIDVQHKRAVSCVNARAQADVAKKLWDKLSEEEQETLKRGRNAKTGSTPRNMDIVDYRLATGLEYLLGLLYITGREERLSELFQEIIKLSFSEDADG